MTWAVLVRTVGWSLAVGVATGALARVAMRGVAEATNGDRSSRWVRRWR